MMKKYTSNEYKEMYKRYCEAYKGASLESALNEIFSRVREDENDSFDKFKTEFLNRQVAYLDKS